MAEGPNAVTLILVIAVIAIFIIGIYLYIISSQKVLPTNISTNNSTQINFNKANTRITAIRGPGNKVYLLTTIFSSGGAVISISNVIISVPLNVTNVVPINLTNAQITDTSIPFQEMIAVNSSNYTAYEARNLQNVEFFDQNGGIIPSWIENNATNTAKATVYWLYLPYGILAGSNLTIFMGFGNPTTNFLDGVNIGEAPQLTSPYGLYDNGQNIFPFYDNFSGNTLSSLWYGSNTIATVNNGLTTRSSGGYQVINNSYQIPLDYILESYSKSISPTYFGIGFSNIGYELRTAASNWGIEQPYGSIGVYGGRALTNVFYAISALNDPTTSLATNYAAKVLGTTVSTRQSAVSIMQSAPGSAFTQWIRARANPPNGIMPGTTFFSLINVPPSNSVSGNVVSSSIPSSIFYYTAVNLINAQSVPTTVPFQQKLVVNSSNYSIYEAENLQNVEFFDQNGGIIPSWIENNATNTSTATTYWLKLSTLIPASNNLVIYMGFGDRSINLFNTSNGATGVAPEFGSTYGDGDNGQSVFNIYCNFSGTTLCSNWDSVTPPNTVIVNNSLIIGNASLPAPFGNITYIGDPPTAPYIMESLVNVTPIYSCDLYSMALVNSSLYALRYPTEFASITGTSTSGCGPNTYTSNAYFAYAQTDVAAFSNGASVSFNAYSNSDSPLSNIVSVTFAGNSLNQFSMNVNNSITSTVPAGPGIISSTPVIELFSDSGPNFVNWFRVRAYPPNGVMPNAEFSNLVQNNPEAFNPAATTKTVSVYANGPNRTVVINYTTLNNSQTGALMGITAGPFGSIYQNATLIINSATANIMIPLLDSQTHSLYFKYGKISTNSITYNGLQYNYYVAFNGARYNYYIKGSSNFVTFVTNLDNLTPYTTYNVGVTGNILLQFRVVNFTTEKTTTLKAPVPFSSYVLTTTSAPGVASYVKLGPPYKFYFPNSISSFT